VSKKDRTVWDDILDLGREVLEKLDEAINPEKRRKLARIPIPVRSNYPPLRNPDESRY